MTELSEYVESCSSTTKNTFTTPMAMATKLVRWGAHTHIVTWPFNHVVLWDHVPQFWTYLHKLNVYDDQAWQGGDFPLGTSTIKMSDYPLITFSCKILWQTKTIISPLPRCIWAPNLAMWRGLQSRGFVRLRDKLNVLYLHLQKTYGHRTS